MKGALTILRRELGAYFNSPMAYVVAIAFMLLNSGLYVLDLWVANEVSMRSFFDWVSWTACFVIPAITMRSWAEEKRGATYELLMTFPMRSVALVAGKFLAALVFYAFCLSGSLVLPLILFHVSTPHLGPDMGAIAAAYAGTVLTGALLIALGIFLSGLCRDQIEAFIVTLVAVLALRLVGFTPIATQVDSVLPGVGTFLSEKVSFSVPFARFARGLVDLGDVAYFLLWSAVLLALNAVGLEGRLQPGSRARHVAAVAMGLPLAVLAGSFVVGFGPRFDWTAERIYTVSPAAVEVLKQIPADEPVRVKLYFSPKDEMPAAWGTLERDLTEKLEEFRRRSKGRLVIETVHLHADDAILRALQEARENAKGEKDKKEGERGAVEEKLIQEGVIPFRVQTGGLTGSETKVIYAALSLTFGASKKETIPQLAPNASASLEQELITRIYRLVNQKKPVVGLMAPIETVNIPPQQLQLLTQLGINPGSLQHEQDDYRMARAMLSQAEQYDVRRLKPDATEPLPADLDTLIVINPGQVSARMAWEIQRFLQRGGAVVMASQAFETQVGGARAGGVQVSIRKMETGVGPVLDRYGLGIGDKMILSDPLFPLTYSSGFMGQQFTVQFHWTYKLDPARFDRSTSLVNGVGGDFMVIDSSSPVTVDEAKTKQLGLNVQDLLDAPAAAWTRDVPDMAGAPPDLNDVKPPAGPVHLAVLVKGQFPAPDGDRPAWPAAEGQEAPPSEPPAGPVTPKPGTLLVIGTSRPFLDQQIADRGGSLAWSGTLLKNSVDAFSLGDVLLRLTLKEPTPRPIKQLDRTAILLNQALIVGLAPLGYLILGISHLMLRKRRQEAGLRRAAGGAS